MENIIENQNAEQILRKNLNTKWKKLIALIGYLAFGIIFAVVIRGAYVGITEKLAGENATVVTGTGTQEFTEGELLDKKRELQKLKQWTIDNFNLKETKAYLDGDQSKLEDINKMILEIDGQIQKKKLEHGLDYLGVKSMPALAVYAKDEGKTQFEKEMEYIHSAPSGQNVDTEQSTYTGRKIIHNGYPTGSQIQDFVNYAYEISNNNLNFVALLDAESGRWNMYQKSYIKGTNGDYDYGFCQISKRRHPEIVNNKLFWNNRKWQLEQCYKLYKGGTKFYGKKNIPITIKRFSILSGN